MIYNITCWYVPQRTNADDSASLDIDSKEHETLESAKFSIKSWILSNYALQRHVGFRVKMVQHIETVIYEE